MHVVLRKRCRYCHGYLDATAFELLPKVIGRPQVQCGRCGRATKLSLTVALASSAAGFASGLVSVAICSDAIAGSARGNPLGELVMLIPLGVLAWILGYLAFALVCYSIQRSWMMIRGRD